MPEQCGNRLEAHAAVDGLGGQGVAQLVGVDVTDPGPLGHTGDVALDGAPVEWLPVISLDQESRMRRSTPCLVVDDEVEQHRQQRNVAIVVQLADRDSELVEVSEFHHGIVLEGGELADAHPGPGQQLDHESTSSVGNLGQCGHVLAAVGSSKNLGRASSREGKSVEWIGSRAGASS